MLAAKEALDLPGGDTGVQRLASSEQAALSTDVVGDPTG
jgi:hypothetical protein